MAIYEILNIHKGLDPDKTMQQRARQIMAHEEELYIIHGAMRYRKRW